MVAANRSARGDTSVAVTLRGVQSQVQRLYAAAGAEVERGLHGRADGRAGQGRRGATDAEDVVAGERLTRTGAGRHVGQDPPRVSVRLEVDALAKAVPVPFDEPGGARVGER